MVNDNNKPLFTAHTVPPVSPDIAGMPGSNTGATESKPVPQSDQPKPADNPQGVSEQNKPQTAQATTPEEDYNRATDANIQAYRSWLDAHPIETPEQQAKREKRERSKRVIAAVSDGLSALGNLFFTTKGAPNMYDGQNTQTAAVQRQQDKLKAEREANADKYFNYAMHIGNLEAGKAKTAHEWQMQDEALQLKRNEEQRKQNADDRDANLFPDKQREQKGRADTAESKAKTAAVEAEYAPKQQEATLAVKGQQVKTGKAAAANSYAHAAHAGDGKTLHHINGKGYQSEKDWEKEVKRLAALYGIPISADYTSSLGVTNKKERDPATIAAEVEAAIQNESQDDTPPSRR